MEKVKVIFRKEKDGGIVAFFPEIVADSQGNMQCYAHIGQHGAACLGYYRTTKPATPEEFAPLLAELTAIYTTRPQTDPEIYGEPVELIVRRRR